MRSLVADLSAQALISLHLLRHFPSDFIIGEEDTSELRENGGLRSRVVELVREGFEGEHGWSEGRSLEEAEYADHTWRRKIR